MRFLFLQLSFLFSCLFFIQAETSSSFLRYIDSNIAELELRSKDLQKQLELIPEPIPGQKGERWGYSISKEWYSRHQHDIIDHHNRIQIDLERLVNIQGLAIFPIRVEKNGQSIAGYGFPKRFIIEASQNSDFTETYIIGDFSSKSFPNPGHYPLYFDVNEIKARYLRVVLLELNKYNQNAYLGLSEIMVFENGINIANGLKNILVSKTRETTPYWSRFNLTDNQTDLGAPQIPMTTPGEGTVGSQHDTPDHAIWFQMNLDQPAWIKKIRLIPIYPSGVSLAGHRFPREFSILASDNISFDRYITLYDTGDEEYHNPGGNPACFDFTPLKAKHVRFVAKKLIGIKNDSKNGFNAGISEMEVYSLSGNNLAKTAFFTTNSPQKLPAWNIKNINDGFASRGKLVQLLPWVKQLNQRRLLLMEFEVTQNKLQNHYQSYEDLFKWLVASFILLLIIFLIFWIYRTRLLKQLELETIKTQIANDLHDGLGSDLSGVSLLSQLLENPKLSHDQALVNIKNIQSTANRMMTTLRDIVHFLHPGENNQCLLPHMKDQADLFFQKQQIIWELSGEVYFEKLSTQVKYAIFMIYKEALHNIYKHAQAQKILIKIHAQPKQVEMIIGDDGLGFDFAKKSKGLGLNSMKVRSRKIGASLNFSKNQNYSTLLTLKLTLN